MSSMKTQSQHFCTTFHSIKPKPTLERLLSMRGYFFRNISHKDKMFLHTEVTNQPLKRTNPFLPLWGSAWDRMDRGVSERSWCPAPLAAAIQQVHNRLPIKSLKANSVPFTQTKTGRAHS
ncbi:hypothetical protein ILYODFUR_018496 [Ilyodon furcidens]|uniref:Uncharacterized protein n=1 Tax=Ilyodon furcidens TaxID=33524 RepID=A0ABV0UJC6_9TELE